MSFVLRTMLLWPVVLAQGAAVRARVPKLPEPPGARQGETGDGRPLKLLIIGDSAAAGVGTSHQDDALLGQLVSRLTPRYRVAWNLQARTGDTTADALKHLQDLPAERFDIAVTSLGVNDVTRLVSLRTWRRRQARLRSVLREKFRVNTLAISGLPPMHGFPALPQPLRWYIGSRATELNEALQADIAADNRAVFVDLRFTEDSTLMSRDGFHPGPDVYAEWARRVAELIQID